MRFSRGIVFFFRGVAGGKHCRDTTCKSGATRGLPGSNNLFEPAKLGASKPVRWPTGNFRGGRLSGGGRRPAAGDLKKGTGNGPLTWRPYFRDRLEDARCIRALPPTAFVKKGFRPSPIFSSLDEPGRNLFQEREAQACRSFRRGTGKRSARLAGPSSGPRPRGRPTDGHVFLRSRRGKISGTSVKNLMTGVNGPGRMSRVPGAASGRPCFVFAGRSTLYFSRLLKFPSRGPLLAAR